MQVEINDHPIAIISEALGGTNVDNCPHACVDRPCGALASCVPNLDNYECVCNPDNAQCNQAEEVPSIQISVAQHRREMELRHNLTQLMRHKSTERPSVPSSTLKTTTTTTSGTEPSVGIERDSDLLRTHIIKTSSEIIVASSSDSVTIIDHLKVGKKENNEQPTDKVFSSAGGNIKNDDDDDDYDDYYYEEDGSSGEERSESISTTLLSTPTETTTITTSKVQTNPTKLTNEEEVAVLYPNQLVGHDLTTTTSRYTDSVTRVYGRYMSVDNDKLIQMDQHLRQKYRKYVPKKKSFVTKSIRRKDHDSPEELIDHPQDLLTTKELLEDMERIMKNGNDIRAAAGKRRTKNNRRGRGACFTGADSYFHYNDAETMRQVISYQIDLNLRFKTHSTNGLLLWTGRHTALEEDDYLSLGIENG